MTDVFVLCVDRDGERGRRRRLDAIEEEFGNGRDFLAENAWELETWVLAGLDLPRRWRWTDIRAEVRVAERTKVECGKAHFEALQVGESPARYRVAHTADELLA